MKPGPGILVEVYVEEFQLHNLVQLIDSSGSHHHVHVGSPYNGIDGPSGQVVPPIPQID
jgi:hypothetical protein